ncbi:hypothetical protein GIB67_011903 [Kingdonia uniflora]|uniref:Protein kinase domain-containing protein n=1 Tax=Kingdonia uniflora TaxID=39325 RepID=A0A7J7M018_9MAGN|nr:hypothetical protein GIB67_011903 [Kingdonia uniflora]
MMTQDRQHQFPTFMSQSSSVVGQSCVTIFSVHSRSTPMMSSTTYSSRSQLDSSSQMEIDQLIKNNVNPRPISQGDPVQSRILAHLSTYDQGLPFGDRDHGKMQQGLEAKGSDNLREGLVNHTKYKSNKVQNFDITNVQTQAPVTKDSITSGKLNPSKSNKPEKLANINGKLYQKLGKIGSGGSSEVFKVIIAPSLPLRGSSSKVGTLSFMSPEAFMCNGNDADGNTIKYGRPSDIWSLGCILYQMVYSRTPFSEYKTF